MTRLISSIVALILSAALAVPMAANAATGKAFMHGIQNPEQLAKMIEVSLIKDSTGKSLLDPAKCDNDGSCGSAFTFLEGLQKHPAGKHLTDVAQVPGFLRTLKEKDAPSGEYWISCLKPSAPVKVASKGVYHVVMHCLSRTFKPGWKVWVDPKTDLIVFDQFCTNPVEKPVKETCVYIPFTVDSSGITAARFALTGIEAPKKKDDCLAVKRVGEVEYERWWPDECYDEHCNFGADVEVLRQYVSGTKVLVAGSFKTSPGEYVLRLPKYVAMSGSKYVTLLCLERTPVGMKWPAIPVAPAKELAASDRAKYDVAYAEYLQKVNAYNAWAREWKSGHSGAVGVWWADYRGDTARVYSGDEAVPQGWTGRKARVFRWGEWARTQQSLQAR